MDDKKLEELAIAYEDKRIKEIGHTNIKASDLYLEYDIAAYETALLQILVKAMSDDKLSDKEFREDVLSIIIGDGVLDMEDSKMIKFVRDAGIDLKVRTVRR